MNTEQKIHFLARCMPLLILLFLFPSVVSAADKQKIVTVRIPVSCSCSADNTVEAFEVILSTDGADDMQEPLKLEMKNGEEGRFVLGFTSPGTYHYTVRQATGKNESIQYDDTVYAVDVYVTEDADGEMSADPVAYVKGRKEKKEKLTFLNKMETSGKSGGNTKGSTGNGVTGGTNQAPKTEDTSNARIWMCLLCLSAVLLLAVMARWKQGKEETRL